MASTCSEWPFDRWSSLKLVHNPSCPLPIWIDICHMSVYIYMHTYIHIHIYTQDPHIYSNSNCSKNNDPSYPSYLFAIVALSILSTQNIINIYIYNMYTYLHIHIYLHMYLYRYIYIYAHVHIYRERERDPPKQETLPPSARHRLVASRFKEHGTEEPLQP